MSRTKQEVRDFLNALQGLIVNEKCGEYNGQCVSLIKALLEFLGAPNPYIGRGNAKDVGDTLVRQGIAANSDGWLRVCVNRSMGVIGGVNYGHIWLDLNNEFNIEQNGNKALHVTKNTRPISQAQQIVNLDQWITEDDMNKITKEQEMVLSQGVTGSNPGKDYNYKFTGKELTQEILDAFTGFWGSQAPRITKEMENQVADGISGVPNYIGKDYNSKFVGQPVVSSYPLMVQYWISQKPATPVPSDNYVPYELPQLFTKKEGK